MSNKKRIAILGSTGSIGTQTLEVISKLRSEFEVEVLTAQNNAELLISQAKKYKPNAVVIGNDLHYETVKSALSREGIKVFAGKNAISSVVDMETIDIVVIALVGISALGPTLRAAQAGKTIGLANKEALVVAGDIITKAVKENGANLLPIDSEHSAVFQCIMGEFDNPVEKIILTASGGPFRGLKTNELQNISKAQALKHPNWNMGAKITIDSATLMNKGFEVIEARWLFGSKPKIEVVIHPQSIIHSFVHFEDSCVKAQLGIPDMRLPIQFALGYPKRIKNDFPRFDILSYPELTFEPPDIKTFRNLALAFEALKKGGNHSCVLNAANEVAVEAFLKEKIGFLEIQRIVEKCLEKISFVAKPILDDYLKTDELTRIRAWELIK